MFANNNYAKVWKIYPKEKKDQKYTTVQLSTSRKDKGKSTYTKDFSGYVRLIGKAEEKAADLEAQDTIKLIQTGVTNTYNKETKQTYTTYVCFDFEFNEKKQTSSGSGDEFMELPEDMKLPFED